MSKTLLIAIGSICMLTLAGIIAMIATSPAPHLPEPPAAAVEKSSPQTPMMEPVVYEAEPERPVSTQLPSQAPVAGMSAQSGSSSIYSQTETSSSERDRVENVIFDAISTQSASGVASIKPMLRSPDPEVRAMAIEGMKQLDLPEAATALSEEAQRSTTKPEDREEMLEAIEFLNLPFILKAQNEGQR